MLCRGVRAENGGRRIEVRGRVIVGADGRHSTVARLVGAEEYLGYRAPRGMYWARMTSRRAGE